MTEYGSYLILAAVGFVAGVINVIAGGGSFLTLPVLIFLGLPPTTANGTNRVGILLQNVGAVWGFHRYRLLAWRWALWAAVPATVGAGVGTWVALRIGDEAFRRILALLMVVVTVWTLLDPLRARGRGEKGEKDGARPTAPLPLLGIGFLVVGFYGGFVQAGVGFLILAATTLAGLDLVRGNAIKVLSILVFTVLSLALFAWQGHVDWPFGLALAIGTTLGGQIGVHLTALKGHEWVRIVVTVTVVVFAIRLWFTS